MRPEDTQALLQSWSVIKMKKCLIYFCLALLALRSSAALAQADAGDEIEPLFFGQLVLNDTTMAHTCTIPAGAAMYCDGTGGITMMTQGQYGVFRLSGYNTHTYIWATIDNTTMTDGGTGCGGSSCVLNVINFTTAPNIVGMTNETYPNADGTLQLYIGATLQTIPGENYDVAPYHGTYDLYINY
jgi:hypothetical protein